MPRVAFDPAGFRERYPQCAALPDGRLRQAFDVACLFVDNSGASPVPYAPPEDPTRETLLELLTCHLCSLELRDAAGQGGVGPISQAAEGSVSVAFALPPAMSLHAAWFQQTPCGATFWAASAPYRGGRWQAGTGVHGNENQEQKP